jgi:hypothetical protein
MKSMNVVPDQTESGREIARRNWERGRADGIRALLRTRFGDLDDLDDLARRLAGCDRDGNIERIVGGATLAELQFLSCAYIAQVMPIDIRESL